uniref:Uncharacterized protein n=1 Tax=Sphaerodactylus townsendi TaxID=933632 RepID=A0ACB8ERA7_9SAUR
MQRRGALTLRSNFAHYGRPTFVYLWHQNREAEPKDYDIHEIPSGSKNLCRSTYWRLGTINEKWKTTYQDYMSQPFRLKEFKELNIKKPLLDEDNFEDAVISRETGLPDTGAGSILPRYSPDHFTMLVFTEVEKV